MRKLVLLVLTLFTTVAFAENISVEKAQEMATDFFRKNAQTRNATPQLQMVYDGEEAGTRTSSHAAYYVFNRTDQPGFVIVAGDDVAMPILGYSFESNFQVEGMPENIRYWMQGLRSQINEARSNGYNTAPTTRAADIGEVVVKLETAKWNQEAPYNALCPEINGEKTVTGCVATAVAIVMKYHQWPEKGIGTLPAYTSKDNKGNEIEIPERALGHTYNWSAMPMTYDENSSEEANNEVATLMYDCGVMSKAGYGLTVNGGTGAATENAFMGLINHMQYSKKTTLIYREWYRDDAWHNTLKESIKKDGPVLYAGSNDKQEGHQFVLDGYTTTNFFSVNWGWSGLCDGYYLLSGLEPNQQGIGGNSGGGFSKYQSAIVGLKKAEENEIPAEELVLISGTANGSMDYYNGLSADTEDFQTNVPFKMSVCFMANVSSQPFTGVVILSLFDKEGNKKEDITNELLSIESLEFGYGTGVTEWECIITKEIEEFDYIAASYKGMNSNEWKRLYGGEDVVDELIVKLPDNSVEEETSFSYNKADKIITLETLADVNYQLTAADGSQVASGVTTVENKVISIDTKTLNAGTYKLTLVKGDSQKEVSFVVGANK